MATKELVTKVWIEPGCIVCDACETTAPTVFEVLEDTCIVRPAALDAEFTKPITGLIEEAAAECPVDVIKFTTAPFEVPDEAPAPAAETPAAEAPVATAASAAPAPATHAPAPAKSAPAVPAPAPAKHAQPAPAVAASAGDPALQALLKAAMARGGKGVMDKKSGDGAGLLDNWAKKTAGELPPDARQARVLQQGKKAAAHKKEVSRREVLAGSAAIGMGWLAFGAATATAFGPMMGRFLMPNALEEPEKRISVGPLKKYQEMPVGAVDEDFKPSGIWMIRLEDRIAALNIICTHLGCIPNWLPNERKFKCPCHGSGYYQNGINFEGPTPRPLERFKILVQDGIVWVDKGRKFQYELGQWDSPDSFIPA